MKIVGKAVSFIAVGTLAAGALAGCAASSPTSAASQTEGKVSVSAQETNKPVADKNDEPVHITFWHSMGGAGGESIQKLTDAFNASQNNVAVEVQYQGTYDEAINKLKNSALGDAGPDVMQLYDIGTRWMIDSGYAYRMQDFIDGEGYDASQLEQNILAYYTIDDQLYSMPFNSSTPLLYYNKDAFKEAGLDPEKAPVNFDELIETSKKLVKKEGDKVTRYGANIQIYGWFFEQFLVKSELEYANNGNGREDGATAVSFDTNGGALSIMNKWKEAVESGALINLGRDSDVNQEAFIAGNSCMTLASTASLAGIKNKINGKFELGTAYLPSIRQEDKGGVSIGGGSLWIMDKKDDAKAKAAWEYVKYMVSPQVQVEWAKATGYFPITTEAYKLADMTAHLEAQPQFKTAINQLHDSTGSKGALLAVFPEARSTIEENLEKLLNNEISAEAAVAKSAETINKAIEKYNKTK
ncbi:ABC transporter substrate-binding protein [Cellulosilyticum sp. I15G10I2]|uniref:ABC transporter substrate-binding protein n=1 Tax=Cellulosilyticum sp. I15G10I2 TaxID=1892843 RepID=UPI00085CB497|nr:ABC transporter substrate-binding protein [Cellulosilyticum sp. I15G10I2]